jgi:hypothetical protein
MTDARSPMTIDQYLTKLAAMAGDPFGMQIREHFKDLRGTSELGMLAAPTNEEIEGLRKAVAIMTPTEKAGAHELSDAQVAAIAADARIEQAMLAIFVNGYAIERRKSEATASPQ